METEKGANFENSKETGHKRKRARKKQTTQSVDTFKRLGPRPDPTTSARALGLFTLAAGTAVARWQRKHDSVNDKRRDVLNKK